MANLLIWVAVTISILLGLGVAMLVRKLSLATDTNKPKHWQEINCDRYRPLISLLDPAGVDYLRRQGLGEDRLRQFRSERRRIFRSYLRSLTQDFDIIERALHSVSLHSGTDRPDLAAMILKQRLTFLHSLLAIHTRLLLQACGYDSRLQANLAEILSGLQAGFQQLSLVAISVPPQ